MSTIQHTRIQSGNTQCAIFQWSGLQVGDVGDAIPFSFYADRSVQVGGILGAGGSVRMEGSNDGVQWDVLTDLQGNDLDITAAKLTMVSEVTQLIRPRVTAGDGTTAIKVTMLGKGNL